MRRDQAGLRRRIRRRCARSYVCGAELGDALEFSDRLADRGLLAALSYVPAQESAPETVAQHCLEALDALDGRSAPSAEYLSIKASLLGFDAVLIGTIAERAREAGVLLQFDALAPESADETLAIAAQLGQTEIGVALPGRWLRSVGDAAVVIAHGHRVRVVKGQWPDPGEDRDPVAGFLAVVDALRGSERTVAVATHDTRLAEAALARLIEAGTPCELELLIGLPLADPLTVASSLGVTTRLYLPYGAPWLPYSLRHVWRRPQIALWVAQDMRLGLDKANRDLAGWHDRSEPRPAAVRVGDS